MKKMLALVSVLTMSSSAFAYSSYDYDDGVGIFLIFVYIAIGILSLIFFFKLWGQTNNVKKIKEKIVLGDNNSEIQYNMLIGNFEEAKTLALKRFFSKAEWAVSKSSDADFRWALKELQTLFNNLDANLPEFFNNLTNISDFTKLFSNNSFVSSGDLALIKAIGELKRVNKCDGRTADGRISFIYKDDNGTEYQNEDIEPYFCPKRLLEVYSK